MRRKCSRYHSETKNGSKNEPHFQGPKNMDMLQFHANNNVSVTFFSAHCNCADFREILKLQCYKNMKIFTFLCCSQQILFLQGMQLHARKTVRRDVYEGKRFLTYIIRWFIIVLGTAQLFCVYPRHQVGRMCKPPGMLMLKKDLLCAVLPL